LRFGMSNDKLRAPTELVHREFFEIAYEALVIPFKLLLEPVVFVVSLYLGLSTVSSTSSLRAVSFIYPSPSIPADPYSPSRLRWEGVYNWNLGVSQLFFVTLLAYSLSPSTSSTRSGASNPSTQPAPWSLKIAWYSVVSTLNRPRGHRC
jgi:hypothetical protein